MKNIRMSFRKMVTAEFSTLTEKANNGGNPHGDEQKNIFDEVKPLNEKERRKKRGGTSETTEQTMTPPKEQVSTDGSP